MTTSRRLHFVVGTSLLGASLSLGCTPKATPDQDLHVNPGPEDGSSEPEPDNVGSVDEPQPPVAEPEPAPEPDHVNVGPVDEPEPKPEPKPEPRTVNTRPN